MKVSHFQSLGIWILKCRLNCPYQNYPHHSITPSGGYSDFCLLQGLGLFVLGIKILNFTIFWGFEVLSTIFVGMPILAGILLSMPFSTGIVLVSSV